MEPPLRICTVNIKDFAYPKKSIPINEVTNMEPAFDGPLGFIFEFYTKSMWNRSMNYTLTVTDSFGNDGCEGLISRNESDIALAIVDFPIKHDYSKVNPVITLFDEPIVIIQAYNRSNKADKLADVFKTSLASFSPSLWISIAFFVFAMGIMLSMRQLLLKKKMKKDDMRHPYFEAVCCFVHHDAKDYSDSYRRIVTFITSVASFILIIGYFCNLMSTDMFIVEKPVVMNNYDDVLAKPGLTTYFAKVLSDHEHFRDADKDSIEHKLWTVMTTDRSTESKLLVDPEGFQDVIPTCIDGATGKSVFIVSRMMEQTARRSFCGIKYRFDIFKDLLTFSTIDPRSKSFQKGIVFRQFENPILKTFFKRLRRVVEGGLQNKVMKEFQGRGVLPEDADSKNDAEDLRDCLSETVVVETPGFQASRLGNYVLLVKVVSFCLLISFMILIFECIYFFWKDNGEKQRRNRLRGPQHIIVF